MAYWTGFACALLGAWLIGAGLAHRRRMQALRARLGDAAGPATDPRSLGVFGEIVRPIILCALAYLAVKTALAFYWLDAGRYLSLFDLAGFLFLLVAYGTWLTLKTKHPLPARATGKAPTAADNVRSLTEERARRGREPAGVLGAFHRSRVRRGLGDP